MVVLSCNADEEGSVMTKMVVKSRVGSDGVLRLSVPLGHGEKDREVTVTIEESCPVRLMQKPGTTSLKPPQVNGRVNLSFLERDRPKKERSSDDLPARFKRLGRVSASAKCSDCSKRQRGKSSRYRTVFNCVWENCYSAFTIRPRHCRRKISLWFRRCERSSGRFPLTTSPQKSMELFGPI